MDRGRVRGNDRCATEQARRSQSFLAPSNMGANFTFGGNVEHFLKVAPRADERYARGDAIEDGRKDRQRKIAGRQAIRRHGSATAHVSTQSIATAVIRRIIQDRSIGETYLT